VAVFLWDFALASVLVGVAFLLRLALSYISPNILVFAVCYPAILAATLIAGLRSGVISLVLSVLLFWWAFVPPAFSFALLRVVDTVNILLFALAGAAVIWLAHAYRRTVEDLRLQKSKNDLLMRELQHRSKNSLAVISSIVKQSLEGDRDTSEKIVGRIGALQHGEAHLAADGTPAASIELLLRRELEPYDSHRYSMTGPPWIVPGPLGKTICLIVHELGTNAVKYGAWSTPYGRIEIKWGLEQERGYLTWVEQGGPPPTPFPTPGFGTFLIERLIVQHDGHTEIQRPLEGLICTLRFAIPSEHPEKGAKAEHR
jgi:two-component sensor histidine kinase